MKGSAVLSVLSLVLIKIVHTDVISEKAVTSSDTKDKNKLLERLSREILILRLQDLEKELLAAKDKKSTKISSLTSGEAKRSESAKELHEQSIIQGNDNHKLAKRLMDLTHVSSSCSDDVSEKLCQKFKGEDFCSEDRFSNWCRKTCGKCGCFDVYPKYCELMKEKCTEEGVDGNFVREKCARSCGQCALGSSYKNCKDDPLHETYCPRWESMGVCKSQPKLMSKFCKRTCDLC